MCEENRIGQAGEFWETMICIATAPLGFLLCFILNVLASEKCKLWSIELCKLLLNFSVYQHSLYFVVVFGSQWNGFHRWFDAARSVYFPQNRNGSGLDPVFSGSRQCLNERAKRIGEGK